MKGNRLFISVIIFQLLIIFFLGSKILFKNKKTLSSTTSINLIKKGVVNSNPNSKLNYFYEPKYTANYQPNGWNPNKATYTINSDTLNERFNYSPKKSDETYRIITLGDSYTFGLYVDTKYNWTELLEDSLNKNIRCKNINKFEVINLGVHGYGVQYEIERYQIRGQKYNPDLLIWMLVDDKRMNEQTGPFYHECKTINPTTSIDNEIDHICAKAAINNLVKEFGVNYIHSFIGQNFNKIFDLYTKKIIAIDLNDFHKEILKNISKPNQVDIFSYGFTDRKYRLLDGHPNQIGHQKIAEDVFDYLTKNKIIPCN